MNTRKSSCPQWHFLPECQKRPDVIYPSEECDIWHHNAQSYVAISSRLPYRTLLQSVCSFSPPPFVKSWIVCMKWVSQDLLWRPCVQTSYRRWWRRRLGAVWFHRSVSFPKISGRSVPFPRRNGIRQWSSAACKMKDTAGATSSAISLVIQQVHYQDMLLCET